MTRPFIIYALPRSRTRWLSKFLTYGGWECWHDPLAEVNSLHDIVDYLKHPRTGIIDTGLACGWRAMKKLVPEAHVVVIARDPVEVRGSLEKLGVEFDITPVQQKLIELLNVTSTQAICYPWLNNMHVLEQLFEDCLGLPFDMDWWYGLRNANIQLDMSGVHERVRNVLVDTPRIERLRREMEML